MEKERPYRLLKNEWTQYPTKQTIWLIWIILVSAVITLAYCIALPVFMLLPFQQIIGLDRYWVAVLSASIIAVLVGVIASFRLPRIARSGKAVSYYSELQDARLRWDDIVGIMRAFLVQHGYSESMKGESHGFTAYNIYFDARKAGFKLQVHLNEAHDPPILVISIGPETTLNKLILSKLRADMSSEFVKRYGMGGRNPFPAPTRYNR